MPRSSSYDLIQLIIQVEFFLIISSVWLDFCNFCRRLLLNILSSIYSSLVNEVNKSPLRSMQIPNCLIIIIIIYPMVAGYVVEVDHATLQDRPGELRGASSPCDSSGQLQAPPAFPLPTWGLLWLLPGILITHYELSALRGGGTVPSRASPTPSSSANIIVRAFIKLEMAHTWESRLPVALSFTVLASISQDIGNLLW